jgi:hypothetical protein
MKRPSLNEIESVLQNELRPEFASLEADRKSVVTTFLIAGLISLGGALLLLRLKVPPNALMAAVFIPIGLGTWWSKSALNRFKSNFSHQVMRKIVQRFCPELGYDPERMIEKSLYDESQLFRKDLDGYEGNDHFHGRLGEVDFRFSELYCWYETESGSGKNRRRQRHTAFRGLFFVGSFQREFFFRTTIKPDIAESMLGVLGRGLQRVVDGGRLVDLEDPEFEKLFVVTSDDQVEARYILTPVFMEKLREFRARAKCNIYLCFVNGKMFLAIETGREVFKPNLLGEIVNRQDLMKFIDMLILLQGVAEEFLHHPAPAASAAPRMPPLPKIKG